MAAPTSTNSTITINEDTERVLLTSDFPFADADIADVLVKVKVVTLPTAGVLRLALADVVAGQDISGASITAGDLVYTPAPNGNGLAYAVITYQVSDGVNYSASYTLTVNVSAINDAPTAGNYSIVVAKNSTYTGDLPNAFDVEGTVVTYTKVTGPAVGASATVTSAGAFTYTPAVDAVGADSFTYSVSDGVLTNTYTVSINIIATVIIPITEVTTASGYPETLAEAKLMVQGTGAFDKIMEAVNIHLSLQFNEGRIKGPDYATVYLGIMQVALTQAVSFALQKPISERQATSEEAKTGLIIRQTKGFDDDAKQKLLKQALDSWSVAYSVAQDANGIPDAIKVNPIDSIMKNAMDALSITNGNNPLGEI
jgi:hypothetical protein